MPGPFNDGSLSRNPPTKDTGSGEFTSARLLVGSETLTPVVWAGVKLPNGSV